LNATNFIVVIEHTCTQYFIIHRAYLTIFSTLNRLKLSILVTLNVTHTIPASIIVIELSRFIFYSLYNV